MNRQITCRRRHCWLTWLSPIRSSTLIRPLRSRYLNQATRRRTILPDMSSARRHSPRRSFICSVPSLDKRISLQFHRDRRSICSCCHVAAPQIGTRTNCAAPEKSDNTMIIMPKRPSNQALRRSRPRSLRSGMRQVEYVLDDTCDWLGIRFLSL